MDLQSTQISKLAACDIVFQQNTEGYFAHHTKGTNDITAARSSH